METKTIATSVPIEWQAHRDLFDWGGLLRPRGCTPKSTSAIKAKGQRPRKFFDWQHQFIELPVGIGRHAINLIKKATDEWWNIYSKQGSFWRRRGYLVPPVIAQQIEAIEPGVLGL